MAGYENMRLLKFVAIMIHIVFSMAHDHTGEVPAPRSSFGFKNTKVHLRRLSKSICWFCSKIVLVPVVEFRVG